MVLEPSKVLCFHLKRDESQQSLYLALLTLYDYDGIFHFRFRQPCFRSDKCAWTSRWLRWNLVTLTHTSSMILYREKAHLKQDLWPSGDWMGFSHDEESWKFSGTRMSPIQSPDWQLWNIRGQCSKRGPRSIWASRAWATWRQPGWNNWKPKWMQPQATCSSWLCFEQG